MVLMLEPLHACNLTCTGCGRIREYKSTINEMLTVEQCLAAVDECGAPIVSICGGEPMIYPGDRPPGERDSGARPAHHSLHQRHVHSQAAARIPADFQFLLERASGRPGTHPRSLRRARRRVPRSHRGHQGRQGRRLSGVLEHHHLQRNRSQRNRRALSSIWTRLGVDGYMLSPAYGYSAVQTKDIFMSREDIREKFREALDLARQATT